MTFSFPILAYEHMNSTPGSPYGTNNLHLPLECPETMKMMNDLSLDEMIHALADRQLGWEEEKHIHHHLELDQNAREQYEKIVRQNKLLRRWWQSLASGRD